MREEQYDQRCFSSAVETESDPSSHTEKRGFLESSLGETCEEVREWEQESAGSKAGGDPVYRPTERI